MRLATDTHEGFVEMPAPARKASMSNASHSDFGGELWTEAIPPELHPLVADVDAALKQQILDLERITDAHHHCEADHLERAVEIADRIFYSPRLRIDLAPLKPCWSDSGIKTTCNHGGVLKMIHDFSLRSYAPGSHVICVRVRAFCFPRDRHLWPLRLPEPVHARELLRWRARCSCLN